MIYDISGDKDWEKFFIADITLVEKAKMLLLQRM